jgi:hypothetical protein
MRTGKRRSAETIMSRGLPGILSSLFVLINGGYCLSRTHYVKDKAPINDGTVAYRCPEDEANHEPLHLLTLIYGLLARRQDSTRWPVSFR